MEDRVLVDDDWTTDSDVDSLILAESYDFGPDAGPDAIAAAGPGPQQRKARRTKSKLSRMGTKDDLQAPLSPGAAPGIAGAMALDTPRALTPKGPR